MARAVSLGLPFAVLLLLSGCGGGASTSGGGTSGGGGSTGGGGGNNTPLHIATLSPTSVMPNSILASLLIFGQGFRGAQCFIDGVPMSSTLSQGTLYVQVPTPLFAQIGVHQVTVHNGDGTVSNTLPLTVYIPQTGAQVMEAIPAFDVGGGASNASFITTADVNGDGLSDVIMPATGQGGSGGYGIAIFYGQTDGNLSLPQYVPTLPFTPDALAAGDVNGDGNVDLLTLTASGGSVIALNVLLGDGHGNFQPGPTPPALPPGYAPGPSYLADLDGDGLPDFVYEYYNLSGLNGGLAWLKNTGNGNFAPAVVLATIAPGNDSYQIADFNHDGKPDLLYTAPTSPLSLRILMNKGNGVFADQAAGGLNGIFTKPAILDSNLDGIPDLTAQVFSPLTGTTTFYSFLGNGDGTFTQVMSMNIGPGPVPFVTGDFDHDGFPDLVGCGGSAPQYLLYLFGDGHGNFTQQQVVGPSGQYLALGDFNGDGLPDVVVPDRFSFVYLGLGRPDRNFPSPLPLTPVIAGGISIGNIDGDGWPDLLVPGDPLGGTPGTVYRNQQDKTFQQAALVDPVAFGLHDMTGKGVVDLVGVTPTNVVIWPNNGTFNFSPSPITVPQPVSQVLVTDLDGDGLPDIISLCPPGVCQGQILWNTGSDQFTQSLLSLPAPWYITGDFNGDGRTDLLSGSTTYLNVGPRQFQAVSNLLPSQLSSGAVADFNGDGIDDLVLSFPGESFLTFFYGKGNGDFYRAGIIYPGDYFSWLAVGDFDGDGKADLAVGMLNAHAACIFFNAGPVQFTRSCFATGAQTGAMLARDLNRDGKPDLAIVAYTYLFQPPNVNIIWHK